MRRARAKAGINLQVIVSLLRLETSRSGELTTKTALKGMQGRILAMALLHETLYRTGNFARVDLATYLSRVANQVFRAQSAGPNPAALQLDLFPVHVGIDQAIPCGLIVNELLTNSLNHGFPEGRDGVVEVILQRAPDGSIRLEVADTGIGLPVDFEERMSKSLGLQLVNDLARQLGGQLTIGRDGGAGLAVSFRADDPQSPPAKP